MQLLEAKGGVAAAYGHGHQPLEVLEECLVDNLLNFAGTPKVRTKKIKLVHVAIYNCYMYVS